AGEAQRLMQALDFPLAVSELRGAVTHLKQAGGKVATLGFCLGGALSILAGINVPEVDAVVCFYGIPPEENADAGKIRVPFLGHFAEVDDWVTPERVTRLEKRLAAVGTPHEIHRYAAQHAFMNDARPEVFEPTCAQQAWERTRAFL